MTADRDESAPAARGRSHRFNLRSGAVMGIFILMVLYTIYFAAPILIPITMALLLALIFSSVIGWLERIHIRPPLGAALVLIVMLGGFTAGVYGLAQPAMHWIKQAPVALHKLERTFQSAHGPLDQLKKTRQEIEKLTDSDSTPTSEPEKVKVVQQPNIINQALTTTPGVLSGAGITIVLLYFLLASGDSFLRSLAHVIPQWHDKKVAVEIARGVQQHISRYLMTVTLINLCLGFVDGLILWAIGMPSPVLWGALIALFNYVPYVGAAAAIVILSLVALVTFNHIGTILLVPAAIFGMSVLEGQFITPHVVGRRLALSPVAIFITLVIWGWMWGIVGAIIAVPMLAAFKLLCEEIEVLNPVAEFLTA
ncbi:MAG TPA: AI-2E family transporter [Gammaproteobacteria bacterium]|nr:AI-2E family transporter [Gammaproteobacteria bacterium]